MKHHGAAEIFPMMDEGSLNALMADIRENGLREPIVTLNGEILDGRNRHAACRRLGVEPVTVEWDGNGTPEAFVISLNLHRRHLTASQRAMIAGRIATLRHGHVSSQKTEGEISPSTAQQAADLLNVNRGSVVHAKTVLSHGTAEEIRLVESGEAAVSTISQQIRMGDTPSERAKKRAAPLSETGRNQGRIQRMQLNAEICGRLRDAVVGITGLPRPADAVAAVRANDRSGTIAKNLAATLKWLEEFSDAWNSSNEKSA